MNSIVLHYQSPQNMLNIFTKIFFILIDIHSFRYSSYTIQRNQQFAQMFLYNFCWSSILCFISIDLCNLWQSFRMYSVIPRQASLCILLNLDIHSFFPALCHQIKQSYVNVGITTCNRSIIAGFNPQAPPTILLRFRRARIA